MPREVTLLLVEDDDIDARSIQRAFKKARVANPVVRVRDGIEALEALRGQGRDPIPRPFLVLLDLNMPRMGGLEFLAELRNDPDHHRDLVFVLTTSAAEEDVAAAYRDHVAGYIVKSRIGEDFMDLVMLLEPYWRIVEFEEA